MMLSNADLLVCPMAGPCGAAKRDEGLANAAAWTSYPKAQALGYGRIVLNLP